MLEISVEVVIRTDYGTIRIEEIVPSCGEDVPGLLDAVAELAARKAKAALSA